MAYWIECFTQVVKEKCEVYTYSIANCQNLRKMDLPSKTR